MFSLSIFPFFFNLFAVVVVVVVALFCLHHLFIFSFFGFFVFWISLWLLYSSLTFAWPNSFNINYNPISPVTNTNKSHLCLATNSTNLPRKIKVALIKLQYFSSRFKHMFLWHFELFNHFLHGPFIFCKAEGSSISSKDVLWCVHPSPLIFRYHLPTYPVYFARIYKSLQFLGYFLTLFCDPSGVFTWKFLGKY